MTGFLDRLMTTSLGYSSENILTNNESPWMTMQSRKFAVAEDLAMKYLQHLQYLQMKKLKEQMKGQKTRKKSQLKSTKTMTGKPHKKVA